MRILWSFTVYAHKPEANKDMIGAFNWSRKDFCFPSCRSSHLHTLKSPSMREQLNIPVAFFPL